MKGKLLIGAFFIMVLVQLFVPLNMVLQQEDVIENGKTFKFKTAPIDPNDPFRGKYISLRYEDNTISVENKNEWQGVTHAYVLLETDDLGFAKAKKIVTEKPDNTADFIKVNGITPYYDANKVWFDYPFDRFYMEESKAKPAENTYWEAQIDTSKVTYALVSVMSGAGVLQDVLIDGISIRELVNTSEEEE